jgi:hypothetical protein
LNTFYSFCFVLLLGLNCLIPGGVFTANKTCFQYVIYYALSANWFPYHWFTFGSRFYLYN